MLEYHIVTYNFLVHIISFLIDLNICGNKVQLFCLPWFFFFFNRPCHLKFFWFMLWPPYVQIPIPSLSPLGIFYPVKFHCCCWCCSSSLWLCISKITNQIIFEVLIYPNNKHGLNAYLHNTLNNQKDPRNLEYHNLTNLYIYIIIGETERDSNYNFKLKL